LNWIFCFEWNAIRFYKRVRTEQFHFLNSLAASKSDAELSESVTRHFEKWGTLRNVKVLKDWMQRPYSFVQFEVREIRRGSMVVVIVVVLWKLCVTVERVLISKARRGRTKSHGRGSEHDRGRPPYSNRASSGEQNSVYPKVHSRHHRTGIGLLSTGVTKVDHLLVLTRLIYFFLFPSTNRT